MNTNVIKQLILNDWRIMQTYILLYWFCGAAAVVIALFSGDTLGLICFIFFVAALSVAGIHPIFQTIVNERRDQNLAFIMSLPITVKEYTYAKVSANLSIILSVWFTLSCASLLIFIGDDGLPRGTFPFFCILLSTILVAIVMLLVVALLTEKQGPSIFASVVVNLGAQLFLWGVADMHSIRSVMGGPVAIWNSTSMGILLAEYVFVAFLLGLAIVIQTRKKDFV